MTRSFSTLLHERALSLATCSTLKSGLLEMASVAFKHNTRVMILTGSSYLRYLLTSCYFYLRFPSFPCYRFITYIYEEYLREIPKSQSASKDHIITTRQRINKVNYCPTHLLLARHLASFKVNCCSGSRRIFTNRQRAMVKE